MTKPGKVYIGTSGWNYKHWREEIYPKGLRQASWIDFIAERFNTVEVNTSFYRIPKSETLEQWQAQTPNNFRFAVKLWRGITHYKKLLNSAQYTESFLKAIDVLRPGRRAPLLIQLPPNQRKNTDKLGAFLDELKELSVSKWRVAVEFRHPEWLDQDVYRLLDRRGMAICLHDMSGSATGEQNGAKFVYVRRHGGHIGKYHGSYSPEEIESDAKRIRKWLKEGRDVYVYYNNDIGGHAFRNAQQLKAAIGQ
ncbi:MAG: DUF72 domain-containing protein [Bryobacteraceae bacterium]